MTVEETILGVMIVEPYSIDIINGMITRDMFYNNNCLFIFDSINDLYNNHFSIDIVTLSDYIRKKNKLDEIGGAYYISKLTSRIPTIKKADIDTYCKIIVQDYIRRQMVILYTNKLTELQDGMNDIFDIYSDTTSKLDKLFDVNKVELRQIGEVMAERMDTIEKRKCGQLLGIPTGHEIINQITSGWQGGDFIIIAARPSMGKTAISLVLAKHPALVENKTVLYFSLEMPAERLSDRILSYDTTINSRDIQMNNLNQSELISIYDTIDRYSGAKLFINDDSGLTVEQIKAISIMESRRRKIDIIFIDYLQLISFSLRDNKNTNEQINHISKNIKALAKKLDIPIIVLSQLNRDVEKRSNKRPIMADLRDSGALEQDADAIIFLYRPEYYGETKDAEGNDISNIIENIIAKNRNGDIGTAFWYKNKTWSYISDKPFSEFESENIPDF